MQDELTHIEKKPQRKSMIQTAATCTFFSQTQPNPKDAEGRKIIKMRVEISLIWRDDQVHEAG